MKGYKRGAAALLAAIALGMAPVTAYAAETAPLSVGQPAAPRREDAGKIANIGFRSFHGIKVPDKWMRQVRLGGVLVNMRLFTPEGEGILMEERLSGASTGELDIRLCLRQDTTQGGLMLQFDQHAIDVLKRLGITELFVVDYDGYVQAGYIVSDLDAMRSALGLTAGEQLTLSGEDAPVTIVSEDGVRREIAAQ